MSKDPFYEQVMNERKRILTWPKNPGDIIVGQLIEIRTVPIEKRMSVLYEILDEESGIVYAVWGSTVIKGEFEKLGVGIGERVGIRYDGQIKNYKSFAVFVDRSKVPPKKEGIKNISK